MKKECSRREFLILSGKGLLSLAFAGTALRFGMPNALAADDRIEVNKLVTGENEMRVMFLKRVDEKKSDAFYIMNTTPEGMELFLIDGGRGNKHCRDELLALRNDILTRAGLADEIPSSRYLLHVKVILSHFHGDHVDELMTYIAPYSHKFRITELYYPQATHLKTDGTYNNKYNDDLVKRNKVLSAVLTHYRKYCTLHEVPFGDTLTVPCSLGEMKLYASPVDWGVGEQLAWMEEHHFAGKPQNIKNGMGTEVINGNCMWLRASYAGKSVLFTGDTNKKYADRTDEAYDLFIEKYGEELRSDVVKFPHHGRGRDAAAAPTKAHLLTADENAQCVLSGADGPELAGAVLTGLNVKWADLNSSDVAYVIRPEHFERVV